MGSVFSYLFAVRDEGEINPSTGLTVKEQKLLRECWNIVDRNGLDIGVEIMTSFFHEHPKYQEAFPTFRGKQLSELKQDRKFHAHCLTIMSTFSQAIEFIHDAELCVAALHMAGERHARRGQDTIPFNLLEPIAKKIIKTWLANKCTVAVPEILDTAIGLVFKGIKQGIDEYNENKESTNEYIISTRFLEPD